MATIRRDTVIEASPARVWAALRDVGAIHTRLAPGFVTDVTMEEGDRARVVTFGNGMVVREQMVDVDDEHCRVAWSATGGALTHHNASAQVFPEGLTCTRFVWIADLLPDDAAPAITQMIEQGLATIKAHLENEARADAEHGGEGFPGSRHDHTTGSRS
ncbi:MAG: SRPBCC family protein [Candidatus Binatia bacterium]